MADKHPYSRATETLKHPVAPEPQQPTPALAAEETASKPTEPIVVSQLSELDAYIKERVKEQPKNLEEAVAQVEVKGDRVHHRLVLPPQLEKLSYDCSFPANCESHKWVFNEDKQRWDQKTHGAYVFHWIFKDKRAIDRAVNVRGWMIANRTYFPAVAKYLFSANGAIEAGDSILMFMPVNKALELRREPSARSLERLESRMTKVDEKRVLMSGDATNEHVYMPSVTAEESEGAETQPSGIAAQRLVEGKDF